MRGRRTTSSKFIYFDLKGYENELKASFKNVLNTAKTDILEDIRSNLNATPFKNNPVRMVGGYVTSDAQRKQAVIESVVCDELRWINDFVLKLSISALKNNFKDSHIGVYYEYGTGEYAEDYPEFRNLETPNPDRHGKKIVSRSRHIDYIGAGNGVWMDAGGNLRVTRSKTGGVRNERFLNYIGEDVRAYHWFRKAFSLFRREAILEDFRDAIRRVPITKYIRLQKEFTLGKD